jgi:GTP cyclohydrolase IA
MSSSRKNASTMALAAETNGHASPAAPSDDASDARPAHLKPAKVDIARIERAVREILLAVGEDPDREGLQRTPNRVARAYGELLAGLQDDPRRHLKTVFNERYDEVVLLRDIEFHSLCEHHLLPFTGRAHLAYLPDGKVVGLSKLARLVEGFARRPQVQERLTTQIADALMEELNPIGAACVIEATHTCMTIRGASKPGATMVTSALRGIFKENPSSRAEVLALISSARPSKQ